MEKMNSGAEMEMGRNEDRLNENDFADEVDLESFDDDGLDDMKDADEAGLEQVESIVDDQEVDLSAFTPSVCDQRERAVGKSGVISIVNSKNGMRVELSRELMERLHHPKTVQIGYSDHQIAISASLGDHYTSYFMRQSGAKSTIYRSQLVKQITERYQLDFRNRTSITFHEVRYMVSDGNPIALINIHR